MPKTTETKTITITAEAALEWAEIEAAEGVSSVPKFTMKAYTGGAMNVGGFFRPVVVDLAGMKSSKSVPIFRGHDPDKIVGHGEASITANDISATGLISAENDHSREVIASSKNGFPWQASIGASVEEFEPLKEGQKATVNGKTVNGPALIARKSTLNEISFVPLGADRRTSAKVAAQADDSKGHTFSGWLEANGFEEGTLTLKAKAKLLIVHERERAV